MRKDASPLVDGVWLMTVEAFGHASTVMVEQHYGHMWTSWQQKKINTYTPGLLGAGCHFGRA